MPVKGAKILIDTLVDLGVDTIFGYPGGTIIDIYNELYLNSERITHVLAAHEQGACHAADGYARVCGRTGVVLATSGPGATNLVTGIANAYLDSVPLVAITGNVSVPMLGKDSFQEVDIVGVTQPIVKHSYVVREVRELERTVREAFAIANSGRRGPVLVDIPKNVQSELCEYRGAAYFSEYIAGQAKKLPAIDAWQLNAAIEAINNAKKPYIYAGGGVIASGAEAELIKLSERLNAPIGLSLMGLSAVPHSYPLNLGMCGMHGLYASTVAQSKADVIIACGVRFSDRATGNVKKYSQKCTIIQIDIDNAELGKNVEPQIPLCGDIKAVLNAMLERLQPQCNPEWIAETEALRAVVPKPEDGAFSPHNIIKAVHRNVPEDSVIATDVGQHQMWVAQSYPFSKSGLFLTSGGLGAMGFGLGAAIGGCIAAGRKRTVHFTSDGSFGMNLNELATAVTQNLPIVTILLNNGVLGMVRQWQAIFYEERYSQTTLDRKTDFVKLAEAFGANGARAGSISELDDILKNLSGSGPTVVECVISPNEMVLPMIPAGGSIEDIRIK